jgi:6-pyruvoyl-tetrahydropterin synthase
MLLDYRTIKNYIKDNYDHRAILNEKDPLVNILGNMELDVTVMSGNPTAENIANMILEDIVTLAKLNKSWDHCTVIVCESPDNSAEVSF